MVFLEWNEHSVEFDTSKVLFVITWDRKFCLFFFFKSSCEVKGMCKPVWASKAYDTKLGSTEVIIGWDYDPPTEIIQIL